MKLRTSLTEDQPCGLRTHGGLSHILSRNAFKSICLQGGLQTAQMLCFITKGH